MDVAAPTCQTERDIVLQTAGQEGELIVCGVFQLCFALLCIRAQNGGVGGAADCYY